MQKPKVFACKHLNEKTMASLTPVCEVRTWEGEGPCPLEVARKEVADVDGVLGTYTWSAEIMDCAPRLRIIANVGVGYDNVDVGVATERGIIVTNTPDVLTDTTADLSFALILSVARRLAEAERFIRAAQWSPSRGSEALLGANVHHATLGIVGFGRIGTAVAKRALGFDMKVIYYDIAPRKEVEERLGVQAVDLQTLLASSDFVSLHVPLTPATTRMIGATELALMKPTAYLINAARGPVVDEGALMAALEARTIAGAGLDVFATEPIDPKNPLLKMDNAVLFPHIGSATVSTRQAMSDLAAKNLIAVLQGQAPLTAVNPEVLSASREVILRPATVRARPAITFTVRSVL